MKNDERPACKGKEHSTEQYTDKCVGAEWMAPDQKKNCRMQLKTPLDTFKLKCHQQYRLFWKTKQEDTTNFPKPATFTKPSTLSKRWISCETS